MWMERLDGNSGVLRDSDGFSFIVLSKYVGCMESNEAEVLAILESLSPSFQANLVVESDS